MSLNNKKIKKFNTFLENKEEIKLQKEISNANIRLIKDEIFNRLKETDNLSEVGYENFIMSDMIMRNMCDEFIEDGNYTLEEPAFVLYQKDFDYDAEKGVYIFQTDSDNETFIFDLINTIKDYNNFQDV